MAMPDAKSARNAAIKAGYAETTANLGKWLCLLLFCGIINQTGLEVFALQPTPQQSNLYRRFDVMNTSYNNPNNLTRKQQIFVEEYLKTFNARQSALKAGYSPHTINVSSHRMLHTPKIQAIIQSRTQEIRKTSLGDALEYSRLAVKPKKTFDSGYIYLIYAENGLTKIGKSINVKQRFHMLSCASPCALTLLFAIRLDNYSETELALHQQFNKVRIRGEWFNLTRAEIDSVIAKLSLCKNKQKQAKKT